MGEREETESEYEYDSEEEEEEDEEEELSGLSGTPIYHTVSTRTPSYG